MRCLDRYGLRLVGGFLPVVLHADPALDLSEAEQAIRTLAAAGSDVVVLAARSADGSYDRKVSMDADEWRNLLGNLKRLRDLIADLGLTPTLHPHVGTAIEDRAAVLRLIESSDIALCLDTGHLVIGGTDPLELVRSAAERVAHVHLKDVRLPVAATVSGGDTSYIGAVRQGLYAPLGAGDLDIAGIVDALEAVGYQGWYVWNRTPPCTRSPRQAVARCSTSGAASTSLTASAMTPPTHRRRGGRLRLDGPRPYAGVCAGAAPLSATADRARARSRSLTRSRTGWAKRSTSTASGSPRPTGRTIVDDKDIRAVSITAPNYLHREIASAMAKAGKHIWIEKPVGPRRRGRAGGGRRKSRTPAYGARSGSTTATPPPSPTPGC